MQGFHQPHVEIILWDLNENMKWRQDLRLERSSRDKSSPCLNKVTAPLVCSRVNLHGSPKTVNVVQEKAIARSCVSTTHSVSGGDGWEGAQSTLDFFQSNQRPLQVPLSSLKE